jgi:hypothetical protein
MASCRADAAISGKPFADGVLKYAIGHDLEVTRQYDPRDIGCQCPETANSRWN